MSLLTVDHLSVAYRSGDRRVWAVRGVSFSINEGDCLGVAGESGSGKTTLALALLKLLPESAFLSAQRLVFDGRSVLDLTPPQLRALRGGEVGFVFQDPFSALNPVLTVGEVGSLEEASQLSNKAEYGLTAGIFSGKKKELQYFFDHIEAGVTYANRRTGATTGAWPGVNSFCGWKGSGGSGKGGCGPYYVQQFMREQSRTLMK